MRPDPKIMNSPAAGLLGPTTIEHQPPELFAGRDGILLIGSPNVGKSSLFNALTGTYVTVSNYPGTTVGISLGRMKLDFGSGKEHIKVADPPGLYSLLPLTEEERVARRAIFASNAHCILHVVDSKNLPRQLPLTLRLLEAGYPVILVLNLWDEFEELGYQLDVTALSSRLGIPVVCTVATKGIGIEELKKAIAKIFSHGKFQPKKMPWHKSLVELFDQVAGEIPEERLPAHLHARIAAILVLEGDDRLAKFLGLDPETLKKHRARARHLAAQAFSIFAPLFYKHVADNLLQGIFREPGDRKPQLRERISRALCNPLIGFPALLVVLYFGFYQFVGQFGAGTVVGWLEEDVFGAYINPFLNQVAHQTLPWEWLQKLFVGDYGVLTLGITYAIAIVLPVVFFFFLVFSMVEDSGYFPRLAMLVDKGFKRIGLNGRAVIPMVLGLGCDTMATMTTRTLETRKERFLATFLLSLAIPCSAQLGIIMALLGSRGLNVWLAYLGVILLILFVVGWVGSKILPGQAASFYMELPPLRLPKLTNVLRKSFARMRWYFAEVVPLFLAASVILWALDLSGGLAALERGMRPLMGILGLPGDAAESFLIGFFRRDFGAAGLFKLAKENPQGAMSTQQIFVASVTLTLFVPCVAQFMMMIKERGAKFAFVSLGLVTILAFATGALLNAFLTAVPIF